MNANQLPQILGVQSEHGEIVALENPVVLNGKSLEQWLLSLESEIRGTLARILKTKMDFREKAMKHKEAIDVLKLLNDCPGQLVILALQIIRTHEINQCIPTRYTISLTDVCARCFDNIEEMINLMRFGSLFDFIREMSRLE